MNENKIPIIGIITVSVCAIITSFLISFTSVREMSEITNHFFKYIPNQTNEKCELPRPDNLTFTPSSSTSGILSWDSIPQVGSYQVVVLDSIEQDTILKTTTTQTSQNINNLHPGEVHECKVSGVCQSGESSVNPAVLYVADTVTLIIGDEVVMWPNGPDIPTLDCPCEGETFSFFTTNQNPASVNLQVPNQPNSGRWIYSFLVEWEVNMKKIKLGFIMAFDYECETVHFSLLDCSSSLTLTDAPGLNNALVTIDDGGAIFCEPTNRVANITSNTRARQSLFEITSIHPGMRCGDPTPSTRDITITSFLPNHPPLKFTIKKCRQSKKDYDWPGSCKNSHSIQQ